MKFKQETAELFVPDGLAEANALARTTHMAIGAHQDDLEIVMASGVIECFQKPDLWYTGIVVTNGSGSARDGAYKAFTDADMCIVRRKEQKKAAVVGEYAAVALLDYPSSAVKEGANDDPVDDIYTVLMASKPEVVYTHNFADKHDTHVGVGLKTIAAIRRMPAADRPKKVLGCEVWRDLDWMVDEDKVLLDLSEHENLQASLVGLFDSQVAGGKRYDLAAMGRRKANATFFASHNVDDATGLAFAMDLTPLVTNPDMDILAHVKHYIDRFADEVAARFVKLQ